MDTKAAAPLVVLFSTISVNWIRASNIKRSVCDREKLSIWPAIEMGFEC